MQYVVRTEIRQQMGFSISVSVSPALAFHCVGEVRVLVCSGFGFYQASYHTQSVAMRTAVAVILQQINDHVS